LTKGIVANVAVQTLTNYANRRADTEIDSPVVEVSRLSQQLKAPYQGRKDKIMNDITASIGHVTNSEVAAAIRYLDPAPTIRTTGESDDTVSVVIVSVLMFVIAALPFISLYLRTS
jgi:hypothetical protein